MRQPDAQEASVFFHVEALGEVQRIIISVPSEEASRSELSSEFERRVPFNSYRDCRAALIETLGVADAVELQSGDGEQSTNQTLHQSALMFLDRVVRGQQRPATRGYRRIRVASKVG